MSKPLFYFFQSTYGGGPAIINNSLFKEYVLEGPLKEEKEKIAA